MPQTYACARYFESNSMTKITSQARERCSTHSLQDQLAQVRKELGITRQPADQQDVDLAFDADTAWIGQHARLQAMRLDGAD